MTLRYERVYTRYDGVKTRLGYADISSGGSPRVNGQLRLRANPFVYYGSKVTSHSCTGDYRPSPSADNAEGLAGFWESEVNSAQAQAYGKLRGVLRKGGASLGVTLAEYRSSREMIVARSNLIRSSAQELSALASGKKFTKRLANNHLEVIFGWQPLLTDIHAAATSVIQMAQPVEYIGRNGSSSGTREKVYDRPYWSRETITYRADVGVRYAVGVQVSNPNLWLAERAGLLNPAAVAWDIVPFSFIVNMFVNIGSLVNSITDFAGLSFVNPTKTVRIKSTRHINHIVQYPFVGSQSFGNESFYVQRFLEGPSLPSQLEFRVPEANWELAAMAASLMVQQAIPVLRIFKPFLNRK